MSPLPSPSDLELKPGATAQAPASEKTGLAIPLPHSAGADTGLVAEEPHDGAHADRGLSQATLGTAHARPKWSDIEELLPDPLPEISASSGAERHVDRRRVGQGAGLFHSHGRLEERQATQATAATIPEASPVRERRSEESSIPAIASGTASAPPGSFSDGVLQGDGTGGSKQMRGMSPFATASHGVASLGAGAVEAALLWDGDRTALEGSRGTSLPMTTQIAHAEARSVAAVVQAAEHLGHSRTERRRARELWMEQAKAMMQAEEARSSDRRLREQIGLARSRELAASALAASLAAARRERAATEQMSRAEAEAIRARELTIQLESFGPNPMLEAERVHSMLAAERALHAGRGAALGGSGARIDVEPSHARCSCPEIEPDRAGARAPPAARSAPCACGGSVAVPRVVVPRAAVLRCGEGVRILRPPHSYRDCEPVARGQPRYPTAIVEPPQAAPASHSDGLPTARRPAPRRAPTLPGTAPPLEQLLTTDDSIAICDPRVAYPRFGVVLACTFAVHDPHAGDAPAFERSPAQEHSGGDALEEVSLTPDPTCHCECVCWPSVPPLTFEAPPFTIPPLDDMSEEETASLFLADPRVRPLPRAPSRQSQDAMRGGTDVVLVPDAFPHLELARAELAQREPIVPPLPLAGAVQGVEHVPLEALVQDRPSHGLQPDGSPEVPAARQVEFAMPGTRAGRSGTPPVEHELRPVYVPLHPLTEDARGRQGGRHP